MHVQKHCELLIKPSLVALFPGGERRRWRGVQKLMEKLGFKGEALGVLGKRENPAGHSKHSSSPSSQASGVLGKVQRWIRGEIWKQSEGILAGGWLIPRLSRVQGTPTLCCVFPG